MDANYYFNLGVEKSRQGDLLGAIQDYTKAINLSSSVSKQTIFEKHNDGSVEQLNVIETNEGNVNVYYNRGCAFMDIGKYLEAEYDYSKVLEYTPNDAEVYFKRAIANYCLGNDSEMDNDLVKAYRLNQKYTKELFMNQFQR